MPNTVRDQRIQGHEPVHVAVGIISNERDEVLIARRPPGVHQGGRWEFPGGKRRPAETINAALARELKEELDIDVYAARPLIQVPHQYPERAVLLDVWRIESWRGPARACEGQPLEWVKPSDLDASVFPAADVPIITALKLPSLYLITPEPGDDLEVFLGILEKCLDAGVRLVQFRAKAMKLGALRLLGTKMSTLCARYGAQLLVNACPTEAVRLDAQGVHLTSARLLQLTERPLDRRYWVAASCHNATELEHACRIGVDFVVLSPVRPTPSHVHAQPLGWDAFARLTDKTWVPVFALGGLGPEDISLAWCAGGQGLAMISRVWAASDPTGVIRHCLGPTP